MYCSLFVQALLPIYLDKPVEFKEERGFDGLPRRTIDLNVAVFFA